MRFYALGIIVYRDGKMGGVAATCVARSKDEAYGAGMRYAKEQFPLTDGWSNHDVSVSDATDMARQFVAVYPAE